MTTRFGRQTVENTRVTRKQVKILDAHIGSRVRFGRALIGMSQTRLGELLGLTFQQIQKYENGSNRVSAGRIFQIAQILDLPIGYFYEGLGRPRSVSDAGAHSDEIEFFTSAENIQLMTAFVKVADRKVRRRIVDLIKSLAEESAA